MKNSKNNRAAEKLAAKGLGEMFTRLESANSVSYPVVPCQQSRTQRRSDGGSKRAPLTAAENRVLTHVSRAKTNKEIAATLGISPATVKRHLEKILTKLQLRNRVEAAIYGLLVKGCPLQSRSSCVIREARDSGGVIVDGECLSAD